MIKDRGKYFENQAPIHSLFNLSSLAIIQCSPSWNCPSAWKCPAAFLLPEPSAGRICFSSYPPFVTMVWPGIRPFTGVFPWRAGSICTFFMTKASSPVLINTTSFTPTFTTALFGTGMKPSVAESREYRSSRASCPACVPSGRRSGVKYRARDCVAGST